MADTTKRIGATGITKKLVDLGDGTYADAVVNATRAPSVEDDVAGATSRLGLLTAPLNAETIFIRHAVTPGMDLSWRVKSNVVHTVQLYKARSNVNTATITFADATRIDDTNTFILNGITYMAESTAADAAFASRKFYCGGADATADAVEVVKLINADYAVLVDGSTTVGDKFIVTTELGTYTFTAAAAPIYASRVWDQSGNQAAELASLVLAINHKDNVTCDAAVTTGLTVTVNGLVYTAAAAESLTTRAFDDDAGANATATSLAACINHRDTVTLTSAVAGDCVTINGVTFYGVAGVSHKERNWFSIDTSDTAAAVELAACINDTTYGLGATLVATPAAGVVTIKPLLPSTTITATTVIGSTRVVCVAGKGVPCVTAVAASAVVSLTRDNADVTITLTSSSGTKLACVAAGGVPGVVAAASGATGELYITPTWVRSIYANDTASDGTATTHITTTRINSPGLLATSALGVVTITCNSAGNDPLRDMATTIQFNQGSADANEAAFADNTLAALIKDGAVNTDVAANSTTAGTLYEQTINGWQYGYLGLTNKSGAGAMTATVGASLH